MDYISLAVLNDTNMKILWPHVFVYIGQSSPSVVIHRTNLGKFRASDFYIFDVYGPLAKNLIGLPLFISVFLTSARHSGSFGYKQISG